MPSRKIRGASSSQVPPAIRAALARVPLPMAVVELANSGDLLSSRVVAANEFMDRLVVDGEGTTVGRAVGDFTPPDRRDILVENLGLLAGSRLDGYQLRSRVLHQNGQLLSVTAWLRRLPQDDIPNLALVVIAPDEVPINPFDQPFAASTLAHAGFLETDNEWNIERCSADITGLLGYEPSELIGGSLLGIVHVAEIADFVLAVTQAATSRQAVVVRARLKHRDLSWHETACLVTAVDDDEPPRLAIVVSDSTSENIALGRAAKLEQHLWRISQEVRAAGLRPVVSDSTADDRVRMFDQLSGRQREIVARLTNGERVPEIAKAMHLSPSTVRNHLTAVFRKFGIHSQVELISLLKSSSD